MSTQKFFTAKKTFVIFLAILFPAGLFYLFYPRDIKKEHVTPPKKFFAKGVSQEDLNKDGIMDSIYHTIPPFRFTTQHGTEYGSEELKGKIYVVDFFFTNCNASCPIMTPQMERIQNDFLNNPLVELVSISADPLIDTVAQLKQYAIDNNVIPGKWHLMTGEPDSIYQLSKEGFYLTTNKDSIGVDHSDKFVLVDGEGHIRGFYSGIDTAKVDELIYAIALILGK